jgi:protein-disulfide isomerase
MSVLATPVTARDHVRGGAHALVTLVEYGDFECPFCGRAEPIITDAMQRMGEDLRLAFRHFPLLQAHPHALSAAEASEAAGAQGQFWPMHDMLFANQDALEEDDLVSYAGELGLDVDRFVEDLVNDVHLDKVQRDFRSGVASGVHATPTFFIDGLRFDGDWRSGGLTLALAAAARARRAGDLAGFTGR